MAKSTFHITEIRRLVAGDKIDADEVANEWRQKCHFAHNSINKANFPSNGSARRLVIIGIGVSDSNRFSEEEGIAFLAEAGMRRPTHEHALQLVCQSLQKTIDVMEPTIAFLHPRPQDGLVHQILCERRSPVDRGIDLYDPRQGFSRRFALAGVLDEM